MTWPGRPKATAESPLSITPEEQAALGRAFEEPSSIFSALSTLRTRRIGLGYRSETGEEETFDWSSRQAVKQREGPLSYSSEHPAVPLTEVEEALIAWAAIGPNGAVAAEYSHRGEISRVSCIGPVERSPGRATTMPFSLLSSTTTELGFTLPAPSEALRSR